MCMITHVLFYPLVAYRPPTLQRNHDHGYWPRDCSSNVDPNCPSSGAGEVEPRRAKLRGEAEESRMVRSRTNGGEARWRGPKGNLKRWHEAIGTHVVCSFWGCWVKLEEFVVGFLWFDGRVFEFHHRRSGNDRFVDCWWMPLPARMFFCHKTWGSIACKTTTCWWLIGAESLLCRISACPTPFLNRGCTHAISNLSMAISRTLSHGGAENLTDLGHPTWNFKSWPLVGCSPIFGASHGIWKWFWFLTCMM